MRILRAVYNYASIVYENLPHNPVLRLTRTRAWYRERRRQTVIKHINCRLGIRLSSSSTV